MNPPLRSWSRIAAGFVAVSLLLSGALVATAQTITCPIAAACTPGAASSSQAVFFGMGIFNVTLGTNLINNNSGGYADGYQDYSCTTNAALVVGQAYAIGVRTNANTAENVRVWIDYNNDGAFVGVDELVFSSDNNTLHTGSITPPASATLGTRLRMRVAADYGNGLVPTACSTPQYSQDEDYSVTLGTNVNPPVATFTTDGTTTCTGCVQFTDASQNLPTAWLWTFGDNTTSPDQNPRHCYLTAGSYQVTLRASNAAGATTSAATTIVYNTLVPVAASCSPQTINYFANYGITRFRLGTIDNASADGSAGYQDFTCPQRTNLTIGVNNPLIVTTGGSNAHDIRVYLDGNNDGIFASAEQVFQSLNTASPGASSNLMLPASTLPNVPMRLRIVADAVGNNPGACTRPVNGQIEDYTVVAQPNTAPPAVNFSTNYVAGGCVNPIQFTDLSTNVPTSWLWDFGDNTTSPDQNPSHRYLTTGSYNVRLAATNANGTASVTRSNAVTVTVPCLTYCAANGTGGMGPGGPQPSPFFITSVGVPTARPTAFSNVSGVAAGGYADYSSLPISVNAGSPVSLVVVANLAVAHRTSVWVDLSQDGIFDSAELLASGVTQPGPTSATFTSSFVIPTSAIGRSPRMRILISANTNAPNPCGTNQLNAEVEDYQVRVLPLATREALALPALRLYPTPTLDGRIRLQLPDARAAGLYATEVQNLLGATLLRTTLRLGPTTDTELDLSALAPGVYVLRLRDAQGQAALRRVVRE